MLALMWLAACDTDDDPFRVRITDVPGIQDLGVVRVLTSEEMSGGLPLSDPSFEGAVIYGRLGAPVDALDVGGATFQFEGTGDVVCVVVDPEAVFWNFSVSSDQAGKYKYADHYPDDGDIDLRVGLSAYYTGSPGVEIGSFEASYTDPSGVEHQLQFDECQQSGFQGATEVHAGRATVEYCSIDTATRAGIMYTVLLETYSLPIDDSIVSFGAVVLEGSCGFGDETDIDECLLPNEVGWAEPEENVSIDEETGEPIVEGKEWFPAIEAAFCEKPGQVNQYCEDWIESDAYVEGEGACDDPGFEAPGYSEEEDATE
ncbi:MAG: hypothetical protein ACOZNI_16895 [Myxococcota bacterium]